MRLISALAGRMARRPIRWFITLWLAATIVWLVTGAIDYDVTRRPDVPPPPETIPYADFLPGGTRHAPGNEIDIESRDLPAHDPSLLPPETHFTVWSAEGSHPPRLVCQFSTVRGTYGWPRQWVRWSRWVVYDVTDPGRPFRPTPVREWLVPGRVKWASGQVHWIRRMGNGSGYREGTWQWPCTLLWAFSIEAVAAALVLGLGGSWTWRARRRLRSERCVACNYDLRAAGRGTCPECGVDVAMARATARSTGMRGPWLFLAAWAVAVLLWLAISLATPRPREFPDMTERLEEIAREADDRQQRSSSSLMIGQSYYGWPWSFAGVWYAQTWECAPGGEPEAIVDTRHGQGVSWGPGETQWARFTDDPTVHRLVNVYWSVALAEIAGLQVVAWFTLVAVRLGRRNRRTRPRSN